MHVFLLILGEAQDIIEVDEYVPVQHIPEHVVHQGLEDGGGVGSAEGHHQVLVMSFRCVAGRFPRIPLSNLEPGIP